MCIIMCVRVCMRVCARVYMCARMYLKASMLMVNSHSHRTNSGHSLPKLLFPSNFNVLECLDSSVDGSALLVLAVLYLKQN